MYHKCPYCGYIISDSKMTYMLFDLPCPKCKAKKLSEFIMVEDGEERAKANGTVGTK